MSDNENNIDWEDEIISATSSSGNNTIQKAKPTFRKNLIAKTLSNLIEDSVKNKNNSEKIMKIAELKMKTFNGLEKGLGLLNKDLFKVAGKGVGVLDFAMLSKNLMETWTSSDTNFAEKLDSTCKILTGTASSMLVSEGGMAVGAKIGAAIGSIFPGAGTLIGTFVGGAIGAIAGSIIGNKIGEGAWDGYKNLVNSGVKKLAGVFKSFSSGGVEFILPKEIPGFKKIFCFNNSHYIAFEYESEKNNFDINEIINFLNKNFLLKKVNTLDEVYDTVLKEIAYGFLNKKELPEISLNFNKDKLLYSIMDDFYKSTLTGNILTFLDYYLKCYVNGGFFKEGFIFNWQNNKNENKDYLDSNIIDFKKYLYDLTKNPNEIDYYSMYDLGQEEKFESNYISAFRIIGNIANQLKYYKNLIFSNCNYFTQYDFDILPKWQAEINASDNEKVIAKKMQKAHKFMAFRVTYYMNKIPFLKPYFELLKMITFAIHYLPNVQSVGLFPLFNKSLQNNYMGEKYCKSIPKVFPPLPIRRKTTIEIKITQKELLSLFQKNNYEVLNKFISENFYETENITIEKAEKEQKNILDILRKYIIQKLKDSLIDQDKYVINLFSDENLGIPELKKLFIELLFKFPTISLVENYYLLYNTLNQQNNKLYKPKRSKNYFFTILSFSELKKEVEEILNLFGSFCLELNEKEKKTINEEISKIKKLVDDEQKKALDKLNENIRNDIKKQLNKNTDEEINKIINIPENKTKIEQQKNNIINLFNSKKEEMIQKIENSLKENKKNFENALNKLKKSLNDLKNSLIFYKLINEELVNKLCSNSNPFKLELNYTKACFQNKESENEKYFPIRGGCYPKINDKIYLDENEEISEELYKEFINSKMIIKNKNKKFFVVKTELRNGFFYGSLLDYFSKNIDNNKIILQIAAITTKKIPQNLKKIKDNSGNSLGHYQMLTNRKSIKEDFSNINQESLNVENNFGIRPELIAVSTENILLCKKLLSLPYSNFTTKTEGGLTPLNLALISKSKKIVDILLDYQYIKKNGDLNLSNELGFTPLHLAVLNNFDKAVTILLKYGGNISLTDRKEENTPIHLMGIYARNEIISCIYKDNNFIKCLNKQRPDGKTALHFISSNSILGTKLLLEAGADYNIFDTFSNTPAKYAFYFGRFDCYDLILKKNKNKKDELLKQKINNIIYDFNNHEIRKYNWKDYKDLVEIYENNDFNNAKIFILKVKKNKTKFNEDQIYNLIDISCKNRNIELLKLLSELISLNDFCLGPYLGKYGLVSWIKKTADLGINIFSKSKKILDNKSIFDFCVLNDDKKLLKYIFKFIEKPSEDFINEISELFSKILIQRKIKLLHQLEKELNNTKFNKIQISLQPLSKNINTSLRTLKISINEFPKVDSKSIKLEDVMKYGRPNILEYLLKTNKMKKDKKFLNKLKSIGIKYNRFDNLYILIQFYPEISKELPHFNEITEKLILIEEMLQESEDNFKGINNLKKKNLNKILQSFNIGLIKLPISNTYFPHLIIKSRNIWAFECLINIKNYDVFILDDDFNTCFDYLLPNKAKNSISFDDLDMILKCFSNKYKEILDIIEIFARNLNNFGFECNEELISYLFNNLNDNIFSYNNKYYNSIFHIISKLNINDESLKLFLKSLDSIKEKSMEQFRKILNSQNHEGNTFLMILLERGNYELSIEILTKYYEFININLHNYLGNSILHVLFINQNFHKNNNNFIIFEKIYEILLKILKKNKNLIISLNRKYNTPFILAANSGCNMALRIMLEFFNIEYLENLSEFSSAMHQACINENINTVRFLIEYAHYNPNIILKKRGKKSLRNLSEGSTPLHAAALCSSIEIFQFLLLHGADPFIENLNKEDAFDISYRIGNYEFLKYITNLKCSRLYSSNDKYLLSLAKNDLKGFYSIFEKYININTLDNYNMVDENMNTLLILACRANNKEIINLLLNIGINPLIKNKDGNTCLHICVYQNNYACAGIIMSNLEALKEKNKIIQILTIKNKNGDSPLHISSEYNLENITLLFISYLIRNDIRLDMVKNSAGLNPLQLSIKNHNYKIALIYIQYLKLNINEILEIKNLSIEKEFDDFIYCCDSGFLKENERFIDEKFKGIEYFISENKSIPDNYKDNYKKEFEEFNNITYNDYNENIKVKTYETLYYSLNKLYKCNILTEELFYNHKNILGNIYIMETLIKWAKNGKSNLIDYYLNLLNRLEKSSKKYLIENFNSKDDELYKVFEITSIISLPYINEEKANQILEFLKILVDYNDSKNKIKNSNYLKFIKTCIITYFDSPFIKPDLTKFLNELNLLSNKIFNNEDLIKNFNYSSSAFLTYEYLFKINLIVNIINDKFIQNIQIINLNKIPCLLDNEIQNILNKYYILHESILIDSPLYDFNKLILDKKNDNIYIINDTLFFTEEIKKCYDLQEKEKHIIIKNIINIYKNHKTKLKKDYKDFSVFLMNFFLLSKQIILNSGIQNYESIFKNINNQINELNLIIPYLYIYSSPKEIVFPNLEKKLQEILEKIQLTKEEKESLSQIALLIPKYCEEYKCLKDFKFIGIKLGKEFKNNPNYDNLSKLISIISVGVAAIMNVSPYLIQCLSVSSFLLYYIELKNNTNYGFKGKLAQIKTGEGKSIIIAMLALANALMGNFVDVITSTHYLAERDQLKFKQLYLNFGISSNNIIKNNPPKEDYNGIILYGTNTDFEFSLLREGIYKENKLYTLPLESNDIIERRYDVAIVDECDNLFLDTARNSARIAHKAKNSFNWIYPLIYKYYNENENNLDINKLKQILKNYENGKYEFELKKLTDERLKELLNSSKIAKNKKLNLDYVIGFDEENSKKQIQIVSLDTGRIQHGSRWTNGIHELVEVKEGIEPETESNVIGSISHPTYFENYKIIFGLTGTIGEETERNEIKEIYKIKCYDVPRNFKELLITENAEIYEYKKNKFDRIIEIIFDNITDKNQPILVILQNIQETIEFGELLKNFQLQFSILNDVQKENEDYILSKSGHCGSILIATNAAGRGTDIIIDEIAKENGGLYVIVGFFPQNSRIEFQAIGRAGRQGNPGKAKIIISKDEEFIYHNYYILKGFKHFEKDEIKALYLFRQLYVEDISKTRIEFFKKEKIYYYNLKKYFYLKGFIISLFENNLLKSYYEYIDNIVQNNIPFAYYKHFCLINLDNIWSEFYSNFIKERGNRKNVLDNKKDYFINFFEKLNMDWIDYSKEIYGEEYKVKIKSDLFIIIMRNIKEKCINSNMENNNNKITNFTSLLSNLDLKDLLK